VPAPHVSWGATPKTTAESAHAPAAEATTGAESAATSLSKGGLGRTRNRDRGNKYKKEGFKEGGLHLTYPHRLKSEVTALTTYPNFTCFDSLRIAKVASIKIIGFQRLRSCSYRATRPADEYIANANTSVVQRSF
jgi:hypothetical protein